MVLGGPLESVPRVVVFLGPPGVGKGTQAAKLADRFRAFHVSTGGLLRDEVASKSALGLLIQGVMERGDLVSDQHLFACLERTLGDLAASKAGALVLLDGVPRNLNQVGLLDQALSQVGARVDLVISFEAPAEDLVGRLSSRWNCKACGAVCSLPEPPSDDFPCEKCGRVGTLMRRADDAPDSITRRLTAYHESTAPVAAAYKKRGLLEEVNGLNAMDVVHGAVIEKIGKIFPLAGC